LFPLESIAPAVSSIVTTLGYSAYIASWFIILLPP
jgi:hypothetical protein